MLAVKLIQLSLVNLIICSKVLGVVISMKIVTESLFPDVFTVSTGNGRIRGKLNETLFDKKPYYSFRGIPFGKAPIGELRFKAPVKAEPWTETIDAFEYGNRCVQYSDTHVVGDEDCLYLNVFVPAQCLANNNETLAVIFAVTGGAFQYEFAWNYGPDFFIDQNVIVVVANHRVGPLGFLSLGLPEYSGNMGLKDQLLALEWVNHNIEVFGGDKDRITFLGHSSGSMSASLHILSTNARKLFQRAILLSGSALTPLLPRVRDHTSIIRNLAEVSYYPIQNDDDMIDFLKQINATFLVQYTFQKIYYYPGFGRKGTLRIWNVIIEKENAINPVLTQSPIELTLINRNPNDIDTLFTYTTREFVFSEDYLDPKLLKIFDEQFEIQFPLSLPDFRSDEYKVAAKKIRDFYLNGKAIGNDTLPNLNQMMSDIRSSYGINLNARVQAAQSNGRTFMSRFSVVSDWSLSARLTKLSDGKVLYKDHTDPVFYLFRYIYKNIFPDSAYTELTPNSQPYQTIKNMTKFYANFVKYGNPVPDQEPIEFKSNDSDQYNYWDITNEGIVLKPNLYKSQMDFWDAIVGINQTFDKNNFV